MLAARGRMCPTAAMLLALWAATSGGADVSVPPFELVVLEGRWDGKEWGYKEPPVPAPDAPRIFTAAISDIESYEWPAQAFTLTAAATDRLIEALGKHPGPGASIEKLNDLKERLGHGSAFERR